MGWEQLGGRRDGKSPEYTLRRDGKQSGWEQDAVGRDGKWWEQRRRWKGSREVAVVSEIHSGFPFPCRPIPDLAITARNPGPTKSRCFLGVKVSTGNKAKRICDAM